MQRPVLVLCLLVGLSAACTSAPAAMPQSGPLAFEHAMIPRLLIQREAGAVQISRVVVASGDVASWESLRTDRLEEVTNQPFVLLGDILLREDGIYYQLPLGLYAPTGAWFVYTDSRGLWLQRTDAAGEMLLAADGVEPLWSRDGSRLAYRAGDGLWMVDMETLARRLIAADAWTPLAWSADQGQLLAHAERRVAVFAADTGEARALDVDGRQIHGTPVWAQDGSTIYMRYGSNGTFDPQHPVPYHLSQMPLPLARLAALDAQSGAVRYLTPSTRNHGVLDFLLTPDEALLIARYYVCYSERVPTVGGLPIPQRICDGRLLAVDSATGDYATVLDTEAYAELMGYYRPVGMNWAIYQSALDFAALPIPTDADTAVTEAAAPVAVDAPAIGDMDAGPGHALATALPMGETGVTGPRRMTVLEAVSGDEAFALLENAGTELPILAASPGYVYVGVKLQAAMESGRSAIFGSTSRIYLIDERYVAHWPLLVADAEGQLADEISYTADEPAELWHFYVLPEDAPPLALIVPRGSTNEPDVCLRVGNESGWQLPPRPAPDLAPNRVGMAEPAAIGETTVSSHWQVTVLEVLPGSGELDMTANRSDPVHLFRNNTLARVEIAYVGPVPANEPLTCLRLGAFQADWPVVVPQRLGLTHLPFPLYNRMCFLPGGLYTGWLVLDIFEEEGEASGSIPSIRLVGSDTVPPTQPQFGDRSFALAEEPSR